LAFNLKMGDLPSTETSVSTYKEYTASTQKTAKVITVTIVSIR
jgi:hypothetical protein